jgi:hypothetical protein
MTWIRLLRCYLFLKLDFVMHIRESAEINEHRALSTIN